MPVSERWLAEDDAAQRIAALLERIERLEQALRFYAVHTGSTDGNADAGSRARKALDA